MSWFLKLYILYVILNLSRAEFSLEQIELIKNYVEKQTSPVKTYIFSCKRKYETLQLVQNLTELQIPVSVITDFSKITKIKNIQKTLIISDSNCEYFYKLLEMVKSNPILQNIVTLTPLKAEDLNLFKSPYKWLIFNNSNNPIPPTTKLLICSDFAVATKEPDDSYNLNLIYKFTEKDTNFVQNDLGKFLNGFLYYNPFLQAVNRSNLMGSPLTVSYVLTDTAYPMDLIDYRYRHINDFSRLSYALVSNMLDTLNCTKIFIQRNSWGYKGENSSYLEEGMFTDLENGVAEIGGTVAFYTVSRLSFIEYVSATTPSDMKFILRQPPLSYVSNIFTLPFELNVWYSLYVITAFATLILYLVVKCEGKYQATLKHENTVKEIEPFILDVAMVQIGAITQQGSDTEPKSISGRIAVFIIFLLLMFLYTAYSANIVVLLQSSSDSLSTVEDLLISNINLGAEDISYSRYFFEHQNEHTRKAIYENKIAPKSQKSNFMSVEEGIKKMQNEFFSFHGETSTCYKVIMDTFQEHEKCGLIEVDYFNTFMPSMSIRKESPYKKIVKVGFRRVHETGIRSRQINRIYYKKPQCQGKGGSFTSVGIIEAYFPMVIFAVGAFLSLWILFLEILFQKHFDINYFTSLKKKIQEIINSKDTVIHIQPATTGL